MMYILTICYLVVLIIAGNRLGKNLEQFLRDNKKSGAFYE